jgi:hypothetical protein
MKRILPSFFLALLLPVPAFADVDVLSAGGSVYLAWSDGTQSNLSIVGTEIQRTFPSPHISIGEVGPAFDHLAAALYGPSDTLLVLDTGTLETWMSRHVSMADILPGVPGEGSPSMRLVTHDVDDSGIWIHSVINGYYPNSYYSVSSRFVPDPVLGLTMDSSLFFGDTCGSGVLTGIGSETRPLQCAAQDPPTQFFQLVHSTTPYVPYTRQLISSVHHQGPEPGYLDWTMLCSFVEPEIPYLNAAGSCQDAILLLWTLAPSDVTICSSFDGMSSSPQSTTEVPFGMDPCQAWAMSCNRDDPGLLLAGVEGDELRVRHYQGEWNPYSYKVADGIGIVCGGDLAVCSDDQGYWIAWMEEGKAEPEVLFVPRDSVTGISGGDPAGQGSLSLVPSSNPLRGAPVLDILGTGPADLAVYDVSGREVFSAKDREGPTPIELPGPGIYFAVVSRGSSRASARFTFVD